MKIEKVIEILKNDANFIDTNVKDIELNYLSSNSKDIKESTLFICKGFNFKEEYLKEAIINGAICYISEKQYESKIPFIIVKDVRKAMALIAMYYYGINNEVKKIGITGTKGKTTTTYFIHNILNEYEKKNTAYISTIDYYDGKEIGKSHNTTPDSIDLSNKIKNMQDTKQDIVVMEISSQAVKLDRIYKMDFDIGAFLNIGLDHIAPNEHKDFKEYINCKINFLKQCNKVFLFHEMKKYLYIKRKLKNKKIITFGLTNDSDYYIKNITKEENDFVFIVESKGIEEEYRITIPGRFNITNALCAIAICKELNIPYNDIYKGLYKTQVAGRMNIYHGVCPIIVDYAHNKLSIENLFKSLKEDYPDNNLKVVVGCSGDKAFNRRKEVGELCGIYAKHVYLTAEDPNRENITDICKEIVKYIDKYQVSYEIIEDREEAIIKAVNDSTPSDIIAIIGKGDETYQIVNGVYQYYKSDINVVKENTNKVAI